MPKHLYLIIASTFIFGLITGAVIFLMSNTGKEGGGDTIREARGITVVAETYGGCERSGKCPSYRIVQNGTYRYVGVDALGEVKSYSGAISDAQRTQLQNAVKNTPLESLESAMAPDVCGAEVDGIAYRYEVTYDDVTYAFDTCAQDVQSEPLFEMLAQYFEILHVIHGAE